MEELSGALDLVTAECEGLKETSSKTDEELKVVTEKAKALVTLQKEIKESAEKEKNYKKLLTEKQKEIQVSRRDHVGLC